MPAPWGHTSKLVSERETLAVHSNNVAEHAGRLAAKFGAGELARIAGLLHDFGKAKPAFQNYLEGGPRAPHSSDGTLHAIQQYGLKREKLKYAFCPAGGSDDEWIAHALAYVIAGHHAGLANGARDGGTTSHLVDRLTVVLSSSQCEAPAKPWFEATALDFDEWPAPLPAIPSQCSRSAFAASFFICMLFSTLIDADWIETKNGTLRLSETKKLRVAGHADRLLSH